MNSQLLSMVVIPDRPNVALEAAEILIKTGVPSNCARLLNLTKLMHNIMEKRKWMWQKSHFKIVCIKNSLQLPCPSCVLALSTTL